MQEKEKPYTPNDPLVKKEGQGGIMAKAQWAGWKKRQQFRHKVR